MSYQDYINNQNNSTLNNWGTALSYIDPLGVGALYNGIVGDMSNMPDVSGRTVKYNNVYQNNNSNTLSPLGFANGGKLNNRFDGGGSFYNSLPAMGDILSKGISRDMTGTSQTGSAFKAQAEVFDKIPLPWAQIVSAALKTAGGIADAGWGTKWNNSAINNIKSGINNMNDFNPNVGSYDELSSSVSNAPTIMPFNRKILGKDGLFVNRTRPLNIELRKQVQEARNHMSNVVSNNAFNIRNTTLSNQLANYSAQGGPLHSYGADWNTGIMSINNGGTHEQNPYEGVQVGMDNQGTPNLVEEGEVIANLSDGKYVFSNRLKDSTGKTFATTAKKIQKELEERPNDPITKRGVNSKLEQLKDEQEEVRQQEQQDEQMLQQLLAQQGLSPNSQMQGEPQVSPGEEAMMQQQIMGEAPQGLPQINAYGGNLFDLGDYLETPKYHLPVQNIGMGPDKLDMPAPIMPTEEKLEALQKEQEKERLEWKKELFEGSNEGSNYTLPTWMRYAPVIGNGLMTLTDALGVTNVPDYGNAARVESGYAPSGQIRANPIGNYMRYEPLDRSFYLNQLLGNQANRRRQMLNSAGGNRAAAAAYIAGLGAEDREELGNVLFKIDEINRANRKAVEEFNKGTNTTNASNFLQAAIANQSARANDNARYLEALKHGSLLRQKEDEEKSKARSENLSNFLTDIGNIGRENLAFNMYNSTHPNYSATKQGDYLFNQITSTLDKNQIDALIKQLQESQDLIDEKKGARTSGKKEANGGYLTIKRRR